METSSCNKICGLDKIIFAITCFASQADMLYREEQEKMASYKIPLLVFH